MCTLRICVPPNVHFSFFAVKTQSEMKDENDEETLTRDGEIFGINGSTNGRSCESHDCCGSRLMPDDLIRFKLTVIDTGIRKNEEAIKAVRVRDGTETCTVGFLPRSLVVCRKERFVGQFAQIIELYGMSENKTMRRKSHQNKGIASFRLLDEIQEQE